MCTTQSLAEHLTITELPELLDEQLATGRLQWGFRVRLSSFCHGNVCGIRNVLSVA